MDSTKEVSVLFSLFTSSGDLLGKQYKLSNEGRLQKEVVAYMESGFVSVESLNSLDDLNTILGRLNPNQALGYGIPMESNVGDQFEITTQKRLPQKKHCIARDSNHFNFSRGPGILMLDCDSSNDSDATPYETRQTIIDAVPEIGKAPMLWCPSSSSFITNSKTGEQYSGLRGQRFYVLVEDSREIPRIGEILFSRLILNGHGYYLISKSGQLLLRTIIDKAVFQAERLDFGSKAVCCSPIFQSLPVNIFWNKESCFLDSSNITSLSETDTLRLKNIIEKLKNEIKPQQEITRSKYIETSANELVKKQGIPIAEAIESIKQAIYGHNLNNDFILYPHGGQPITVAEVLTNPLKWNGTRFADPIEPDYRNDPRVSWLNCNKSGPPRLYSHAHGLHSFTLIGKQLTITISSGNTSQVVDETLKVLKNSGQIFDYGNNSMARISDSQIYPITKNDIAYLKDFSERNAYYERRKFDSCYHCNVPADVIHRIIAKNGERNLPKLKGLISAPTLKLDGTLIQDPGYDESSNLYLLLQEQEFPKIPVQISDEEILQSTQYLLEPFEKFAFEDSVSRSIMFAGLLTAVVRSSINTRPAFAFDAPAAGSGKTLLGSCISALAGGTGATQPSILDDDELRKVFLTLLRQGASDIFLDNVIGILDGAAINHLLTAPIYQGRILGHSEIISVPNNAILLLTGNNLRIHKDLMRRVLVCRLDTGMEKPYTKHFSFCPLGLIRAQRMKYIRHALIILRGCLSKKKPNPENNLGSFEEWDYLVRRSILTVCDLIKAHPKYSHIELSDPIENMIKSAGDDPESSTIDLVLRGLQALKNSVALSPREIYTVMLEGHPFPPKIYDEKALLKEALQVINDDMGGKLTSRKLGAWLLNRKDRVVGGLKLVGVKDSQSQGYIWRAIVVSETGSTGTNGTF